jgi:hypothetical protein
LAKKFEKLTFLANSATFTDRRIDLDKTEPLSGQKIKHVKNKALRHGLVVSSPPAIEEIGAMGREIESRQSIEW